MLLLDRHIKLFGTRDCINKTNNKYKLNVQTLFLKWIFIIKEVNHLS